LGKTAKLHPVDETRGSVVDLDTEMTLLVVVTSDLVDELPERAMSVRRLRCMGPAWFARPRARLDVAGASAACGDEVGLVLGDMRLADWVFGRRGRVLGVVRETSASSRMPK
jgi:hypothetical protein